MKQYTIYECEKCRKQSKDRETIMECEASHLGLTIAEMQEWKNLKENARRAGAVVGTTKNEQTDKTSDEAIEKLLAFENEHEIFKKEGNFMNEKTRQIAEKIQKSNNICYAYLYTADDKGRQEFVFEGNAENIANFIGMHFFDAREIIVTDIVDNLILNTYGAFINQCTDRQFCTEVLDVLIPIQCGEKQVEEFPMISREDWMEYGNQSGF